MITVVLADDHVIFREGLRTLLSFQPDIHVIGEASDGNAALALIRAETPDVAVLDISMPMKTGIEVVKEASGIDTSFIILTMHKDTLKVSTAFKSGVKGYLIKDSAFEELVTAIKEVNSGRQYISPSASILSLQLQQNEMPQLTERETVVLRMIAEGKSSRQISDILSISIKTAETHRTNIMSKLNLHKAADLVRYAIENGLLSL